MRTFWLNSKDTSAKAAKVPFAAMAQDCQQMTGNLKVTNQIYLFNLSNNHDWSNFGNHLLVSKRHE